MSETEAVPRQKVLNLAEAAALVRCSRAHLSNIVNGKVHGIPRLPTLRIGRRVLFRRESLELYGRECSVLWINEYFGPVARDGKSFNQMQVYLDHQDKVLASVGIPRRSADTSGETIRALREKKLTFAEAIASPEFMLVQKSRLHIVRRELFEQLEKTPFA